MNTIFPTSTISNVTEEEATLASRFTCVCASTDITPLTPTPLAGSGDRLQPWNRIESRLEANAVLLSEGTSKVLLIAADLLYFGPQLIKAIEKFARDALDVPREAIVLTASHTHFAPAADSSKPLLGEFSVEFNQFLEIQFDSLIRKLSYSAPAEVRLSTAEVTTNLNVNRRRRWPLPILTRSGIVFRPIVLAPAPDKKRDQRLEVIKMVDTQGRIVCIAWKFACHPVCYPGGIHVSAEFPGRARARLREEIGSEIPVLFWQGFAGDVRPNLIGETTLRGHISTLRRGPGFGTPSLKSWTVWSEKVAAALIQASRNAERPIKGKMFLSVTAIQLAELIDGEDTHMLDNQSMSIQRLSFSNEFAIVFVGAEVCSPYLDLLSSGMPTIFVGYTGQVFGYLPTEIQAQEGGYEGGGFFKRFGLSGRMRGGFQKRVLSTAQKLNIGMNQPPSEP
jgi:hypothetical protein